MKPVKSPSFLWRCGWDMVLSVSLYFIFIVGWNQSASYLRLVLLLAQAIVITAFKMHSLCCLYFHWKTKNLSRKQTLKTRFWYLHIWLSDCKIKDDWQEIQFNAATSFYRIYCNYRIWSIIIAYGSVCWCSTLRYLKSSGIQSNARIEIYNGGKKETAFGRSSAFHRKEIQLEKEEDNSLFLDLVPFVDPLSRKLCTNF